MQLLPSGAQPAYEDLLHFFNESADLFCIAGFDGKFKRLNPAWRSTLGWTLANLKARPYLDYVFPDDGPATLAEMERLASGATTVRFENRFRCKDGSWKWLQWTAKPVMKAREFYAVGRDITAQKRIEKEILDTLDRERERMGRELHDGICQELAAIAALSVSLARQLPPAATPESAAAREIGRLLGQSIRHARKLAQGLDPMHLEAINLVTALTDFCVNTETIFKIDCRLHCKALRPKLNAHRKVHLYRIAQEAVNNAITHGRARQIDITLAFQDGHGTLAIQDDGSGIAVQRDRHRGLGLHTMSYRARLLGGSLELMPRSPRGTVVTCVFPIPANEPVT